MEPGLVLAGWDDEPHSFAGQQNFTDGRIFAVGDKPRRKSRKRADYILRFARDFKIAVVEAKAKYKSQGDGLQLQKEGGLNYPLLSRDNRICSSFTESETLEKVPLVAIDYVYISPECRKRAEKWRDKNLKRIITLKEGEEEC